MSTAPVGWTMYGLDLSNSQYNPHATSLNASNVSRLKERWRYQYAEGATSTPAVYEDTVYFGGWNGHVYAANAETGEPKWQRRLGNIVRSSPLVTQDRIYIAADTTLFALDRSDGETVFATKFDSSVFTFTDSSPKLVDGLLILGVTSAQNGLPTGSRTFFGSIVAIDAQSGVEVWRVWTSGDENPRCKGGAGASVWSSAAIDEDLGLAYIGTGQAYEDPLSPCSCALLALHYERDFDGDRLAWVVQFTPDVFNAFEGLLGQDADIGAAPNLFEAQGMPVVGVGDKPGSYRVFDRRTGELVWRTNLDVGSYAGYGGVLTTAAVHDGTIYVASNRMYPDVLDPDSTRFESTIFALDTETGATRWKVPIDNASMGSFAVVDDLLFHGDAGGQIYARELATGEQIWNFSLESSIGNLSVAGGWLYVSGGWGLVGTGESDQNGIVASFSLGDGPRVVWEPAPNNPPALSVEQCKSTMADSVAWTVIDRPSDDCMSCLCECDPTAAGYCDQCWLFASCSVTFCSETESPADTRSCLVDSCAAKLLPNYIIESNVATAPCVRKCAQGCGF